MNRPSASTPRIFTVDRVMILRRGITQCCPNCGGRTLFPNAFSLRINPACPRCGLLLEHEEGSSLGAMSLNFGVTLIGYLLPLLGFWLGGLLSDAVAVVLAGIGALLVPVLLYRPSQGWWLMNYYLVFPHHLPANLEDKDTGADKRPVVTKTV